MSLKYPYFGPLVLVAGVDVNSLPAGGIAPGIKLVSASFDAGQINLEVLDSSGRPSERIDIVSPDICAGIALSDDGFQLLRTVADTLRRTMCSDGSLEFEIVRVAPETGHAEVVSAAVQLGLMRSLGDMARRNAELVRALAVVRREHEVLQDAFASLEEVVAAGNLPDRPAFALSPTRQCLSAGRNWAKGELVFQRLPVSSRAVSALDLCFLVIDEESKGSFDVVLRSLEDRAEAGRWRIPFSQVADGWNRLQLEQGMVGQPRTLEVEVQVDVDYGEAPDLVLSAPSALEDARYRTSSGTKGDCPLAFRVWRSLPGLRTGPIVGAFRTYGSAPAPALQRLSTAMLASAQPVGDANANPEQHLVQYIEEQGELQVHPRPGGIVAAFLKGAIPPFSSRVSASVITRHPQADVLDYAIVAVHGRISLDDVLVRVARADGPAEGFSGWSAIAPMETSQIHLSFEHAPRTSLDLVLMTRTHEGTSAELGPLRRLWASAVGKRGHTRFAWARFTEIQIEVANQ